MEHSHSLSRRDPAGFGLGAGIGGRLALASRGAQYIPAHIRPQLFAAHARGRLDGGAVVGRHAVQAPGMNHSVRGQAKRAGQGCDATRRSNGALKAGVF